MYCDYMPQQFGVFFFKYIALCYKKGINGEDIFPSTSVSMLTYLLIFFVL